MVRIRGYAKTRRLRRRRAARPARQGVPLRVRDVATVELGPESRRGVSDLDGKGDAVGRHRRHAPRRERAQRHPPGRGEAGRSRGEPARGRREVVTTYTPLDLILRALDTLKHELVLEMIVVSLVILLFLWHFRRRSVPIVTIPISVLLSFIPPLPARHLGQHHDPGRHRDLDRRAGGRRHRRVENATTGCTSGVGGRKGTSTGSASLR